MHPIIIQVSSVTAAMRGKKVLERNGIRSYMSRTTKDNGENGCGYSLVVYQSGDKAGQLLREAGITIRGIRQGDGIL